MKKALAVFIILALLSPFAAFANDRVEGMSILDEGTTCLEDSEMGLVAGRGFPATPHKGGTSRVILWDEWRGKPGSANGDIVPLDTVGTGGTTVTVFIYR